MLLPGARNDCQKTCDELKLENEMGCHRSYLEVSRGILPLAITRHLVVLPSQSNGCSRLHCSCLSCSGKSELNRIFNPQWAEQHLLRDISPS